MKEMVLAVSKFGEGMVVPCEATPSGMLSLSVIDALPAMRAKVRSLQVFRHGPNAAAVIRDALSKALVHYYPLAGRIVESPVLQLSCTGEGVWFVEASAQCNLEAIDYLDSDFMDWRFQLLPPSPPEKDGFDPLVLVQASICVFLYLVAWSPAGRWVISKRLGFALRELLFDFSPVIYLCHMCGGGASTRLTSPVEFNTAGKLKTLEHPAH